jgi:hypothetical protein
MDLLIMKRQFKNKNNSKIKLRFHIYGIGQNNISRRTDSTCKLNPKTVPLTPVIEYCNLRVWYRFER